MTLKNRNCSVCEKKNHGRVQEVEVKKKFKNEKN